jgi:hypothetical protein
MDWKQLLGSITTSVDEGLRLRMEGIPLAVVSRYACGCVVLCTLGQSDKALMADPV